MSNLIFYSYNPSSNNVSTVTRTAPSEFLDNIYRINSYQFTDYTPDSVYLYVPPSPNIYKLSLPAKDVYVLPVPTEAYSLFFSKIVMAEGYQQGNIYAVFGDTNSEDYGIYCNFPNIYNQLPKVDKPYWNEEATLFWNKVDNATSYMIKLYCNNELLGTFIQPADSGYFDFSGLIFTYPPGDYRFTATVQAIGNDIWQDGEPSDLSEAFVLPCYKLTIRVVAGPSQPSPGSVGTIPAEGEYWYWKGTEVVVQAYCNDPFFRFEDWADYWESKNGNIATVKMDGHRTITAMFSQLMQLLIDAQGKGTTLPNPGLYLYDAYSTLDIRAIPQPGWKFVEWEGDISGDKDTVTITFDSNKNILAKFEEIPEPSLYRLYYAIDTDKAYWNVDETWKFFATKKHSNLEDLDSDDHTQYLNQERHDIPERHILGEVVPHDTFTGLLDTPENYSEQEGKIVRVNSEGTGLEFHALQADDINALRKNLGTILPEASASFYGQFFLLIKEEADELYICTKNNNEYVWKKINL